MEPCEPIVITDLEILDLAERAAVAPLERLLQAWADTMTAISATRLHGSFTVTTFDDVQYRTLERHTRALRSLLGDGVMPLRPISAPFFARLYAVTNEADPELARHLLHLLNP